jgi:hypothetical protein
VVRFQERICLSNIPNFALKRLAMASFDYSANWLGKFRWLADELLGHGDYVANLELVPSCSGCNDY